eukprot:SAG25_NODE_451_length_7883_cov_4.820631_2_plen_147_part_00
MTAASQPTLPRASRATTTDDDERMAAAAAAEWSWRADPHARGADAVLHRRLHHLDVRCMLEQDRVAADHLSHHHGGNSSSSIPEPTETRLRECVACQGWCSTPVRLWHTAELAAAGMPTQMQGGAGAQGATFAVRLRRGTAATHRV